MDALICANVCWIVPRKTVIIAISVAAASSMPTVVRIANPAVRMFNCGTVRLISPSAIDDRNSASTTGIGSVVCGDPDGAAPTWSDIVELETAIAQASAAAEKRDPELKRERSAKRRAGRGKLPAHLQRVEMVLAPESTA